MCFEIPMYICYEHSMYVSHIRIWVWYKSINCITKLFLIFFKKHSSANKLNKVIMAEIAIIILVMWGMILLLLIYLPQLWRWSTTLNFEMWSLPDTLQVCIYCLVHNLRIHGFRATWLCLIITVLATQAKLLGPSGYYCIINCTITFCTTNFFGCFCGVMV